MSQDEENPWKTSSSRTIYQNPWIRVREDQVIRPDGQPGIYGVVETRIATAVVALTENQEIYLVGQYRYPTDRYSWEVIEGGNDEGEPPLAAAKRELKEEAGLLAKNWRPLGEEVQVSNCISAEIGLCFLAQDLKETEAEPDGTEVLKIKRLPFEQAVEMVHKGEIQDSLSIIAILRAEHLRQTGELW